LYKVDDDPALSVRFVWLSSKVKTEKKKNKEIQTQTNKQTKTNKQTNKTKTHNRTKYLLQ